MTTIYRDEDADLERLRGRRVAVVGYGNQGRSWALNLRDCGAERARLRARRRDPRGRAARRLRSPPTSRPRTRPTSSASSSPTT